MAMWAYSYLTSANSARKIMRNFMRDLHRGIVRPAAVRLVALTQPRWFRQVRMKP